MTSDTTREALKRTLSTGSKKFQQQGLDQAWLTRLSIESLYASLLNPDVESKNPALVSFIRAEGLPELVVGGGHLEAMDPVADYVQLHLKYVNKYSYSTQMGKLVREKALRVNRLWFVMAHYASESSRIVTSLEEFITKCTVKAIEFDFVLCESQNYSSDMVAMLQMVDQVLLDRDSADDEVIAKQSLAHLPISKPFNCPSRPPTRPTLRLDPFLNLSSLRGPPLLGETLTPVSPTTEIVDHQIMMTSCPALDTVEYPPSSSGSIQSLSPHQTPTPLTSPNINTRTNPFEAFDHTKPPRRSIAIGHLSHRKRSLVRGNLIEGLCFKSLDSQLLETCLDMAAPWRLKTIHIHNQESIQSLEAALTDCELQIMELKQTTSLPRLKVRFENCHHVDNLILTSQMGQAFVQRVRELYPLLTFDLCLNSQICVAADSPETVENMMSKIKYSDIGTIVQDTRHSANDYGRSMRIWRQLIALLENLETVHYLATVDTAGNVLYDSWNSCNWMWELYTRLRQMTFLFTLEETQQHVITNHMAIDVPQHVKCLDIHLDFSQFPIKSFNIRDKVSIKGSFLAKINIQLILHPHQSSLELLCDASDNPAKLMFLNTNRPINVHIQSPKPLFEEVTLSNCTLTT